MNKTYETKFYLTLENRQYRTKVLEKSEVNNSAAYYLEKVSRLQHKDGT